jgi:hypothetical protein
MGRSRKARRRLERQRARHPVRRRASSPVRRIGLGVLGSIGVISGAVLLLHATSVNESRIARIAGILIVVGLAALAAAALGWV